MNESKKIFDRALRFLSRRDHSRYELERKLLRHGSRRQVEEVLQKLEHLDYLNDVRYARQRAGHLRINRFWGDRRIAGELRSKRIEPRAIDQVLASLAEEHPESEALSLCIQQWESTRGKPATRQELKRLFDRCVRLGFPAAMVRESLSLFFQSISWTD